MYLFLTSVSSPDAYGDAQTPSAPTIVCPLIQYTAMCTIKSSFPLCTTSLLADSSAMVMHIQIALVRAFYSSSGWQDLRRLINCKLCHLILSRTTFVDHKLI